MNSHELIPTVLSGLATTEELSTDRQFATTLARGIDVLRAFTADTPELGNNDLVARTGLPKATVSRLTYTLGLLGFLSRDPGAQKYRLGSGVLALAYPMLASLAVRQVARPHMMAIARESGGTVSLGMRDRTSLVYIDSYRGDPDSKYQVDIGSTLPMLSGPMGRALLIATGNDERTALLNRIRVSDPQRFAQEEPMWTRDQKHYHAHGFCLSKGEWQDAHVIAVPIRQGARQEPFAINCIVGARRDQDDFLEHKVAPQLVDAARQIELSLAR